MATGHSGVEGLWYNPIILIPNRWLWTVSQITQLGGLSETQGHLQFPGPHFLAMHSIYIQPIQLPMWARSHFNPSKDIPVKLIFIIWQQTYRVLECSFGRSHILDLCVFVEQKNTLRVQWKRDASARAATIETLQKTHNNQQVWCVQGERY